MKQFARYLYSRSSFAHLPFLTTDSAFRNTPFLAQNEQAHKPNSIVTMSFATINVPSEYGFVILGTGFAPFFVNLILCRPVMEARERLNVHYPNCYAVPGVHEKADEFNRVQRSHQNFLEGLDQYMVMTLLGGLKYPVACALGSVCFFVGSYLYQKGYIDTKLDVSLARYKKGGAIKFIGTFTSLISTISLAYSVITAK